MKVKDIIDQYNYTHVVCCGGFTRPETPALSEAESFLNVWDDTRSWPKGESRGNHPSVFLDDLSLDSAENVYLGLMAAREGLKERGLGNIPIRRIGVSAAWKFKKKRFNCLARELGIIDCFYFEGLAWADEAEAGEAALQGEMKQMKEMAEVGDYLLISAALGTSKRKRRYQGPNYDDRLNMAEQQFPKFICALKDLWSHGPQDESRKGQFVQAFWDEVVDPAGVLRDP
jgi:hypothetical protein